MFRFVLLCSLLWFPIHVKSADDEKVSNLVKLVYELNKRFFFQIIVTPKLFQDFKWNLDIAPWFSLSPINKGEAAHIREEIQDSVHKGTHAVDLDVADYKGKQIKVEDFKETHDKVAVDFENKRQDGFLKRLQDIFKLFL